MRAVGGSIQVTPYSKPSITEGGKESSKLGWAMTMRGREQCQEPFSARGREFVYLVQVVSLVCLVGRTR